MTSILNLLQVSLIVSLPFLYHTGFGFIDWHAIEFQTRDFTAAFDTKRNTCLSKYRILLTPCVSYCLMDICQSTKAQLFCGSRTQRYFGFNLSFSWYWTLSAALWLTHSLNFGWISLALYQLKGCISLKLIMWTQSSSYKHLIEAISIQLSLTCKCIA